MSSAVLLVTDYIFGSTTAVICTVGTALILYGFWYVLPVARRLKIS
jgi:hypothetical protein